jgi:hypothetical protein
VSRWSARYRAFYTADTVDTVDTVHGIAGSPPYSVNSVNSVTKKNIVSDAGAGAGSPLDRPFSDDAEERAAIQAEALPVEQIAIYTQRDRPPQPGEFCGGCRGRIFWTEVAASKGWRCCRCHGPAHLVAGEWQAVAT